MRLQHRYRRWELLLLTHSIRFLENIGVIFQVSGVHSQANIPMTSQGVGRYQLKAFARGSALPAHGVRA